MTTATLPTTVALTRCPADLDGTRIFLSGLYDVIEFMPYEPSNYVHSPGFIVGRPEDHDDADAPSWWVDEAAFIEQVNPSAHASMLVQEREMDYYESEGKPYFPCPMLLGDVDENDEDKGHSFYPTGREHGWMESFVGPVVATETRCASCGAIRWDVG